MFATWKLGIVFIVDAFDYTVMYICTNTGCYLAVVVNADQVLLSRGF